MLMVSDLWEANFLHGSIERVTPAFASPLWVIHGLGMDTNRSCGPNAAPRHNDVGLALEASGYGPLIIPNYTVALVGASVARCLRHPSCTDATVVE